MRFAFLQADARGPHERDSTVETWMCSLPQFSEASAVAMAHENTQTGRVQGSPVFDEMGERLGSIVGLTIDKMAGRVREVLLEVGGFLGVGATRCSLPWSALTYSSTLNGYVVARARAKSDRSVDEPAFSPQVAFDAHANPG